MFKILLLIFLIAIGLFFSFSWAIVYHLARFGANRRKTKLIAIFFIGGSFVIVGFTLWGLLGFQLYE